MTKAKSTKATEPEPEESGAKVYRHSRSGAIRRSSSAMGYPWVEYEEPEAEPEAEEEPTDD